MVELKRKKNETFESFLRRFNRKYQGSGQQIQVKKIRYFERPKSKNLKRQSALHRTKMRDKRDYLKRTGQLPEEELKRNYKRS